MRLLYDALHDMMDPENIPKLMEEVEVAPLAFVPGAPSTVVHHPRRGAEHHRRADEMFPDPGFRIRFQVVVTGDISQVDLPGRHKSGWPRPRILDGTTSVSRSSPAPTSCGTGWSPIISSTPTVGPKSQLSATAPSGSATPGDGSR